jgi:hypothetical protein
MDQVAASSSNWHRLARNADQFLIPNRTDCLAFLSPACVATTVKGRRHPPSSSTGAGWTGSAGGRPDPTPSVRRWGTVGLLVSHLSHAESQVLWRADRYHQYRRPPTGRPVAPRIHKTAPITSKMIPSVVRIPMSVNHPSRSKTNPRMSTQLPPQSTSRAMRRALSRPDSARSCTEVSIPLALLASAGRFYGGQARCDDVVAPFDG